MNSASLIAANGASDYVDVYQGKPRTKNMLHYLGNARTTLPLIWTAAFREKDYATFEDKGGNSMQYLQTTVEESLQNLEAAKPVLRKFFCPDGYLDQYVDALIQVLKKRKEKYLIYEVFDIASMVGEEEFDEDIRSIYKMFHPTCQKPDYDVIEQYTEFDYSKPIYPVRGLHNRQDDHWEQSLALIGGLDEEDVAEGTMLEEPVPASAPMGKFKIIK